MNFWLQDYPYIWHTCQQMFTAINIILHLLFAAAVAKDCGLLIKRGLQPILVSPATWAFTTLVGGVWVAGLYWLLHHSNLTRMRSPLSEHKD